MHCSLTERGEPGLHTRHYQPSFRDGRGEPRLECGEWRLSYDELLAPCTSSTNYTLRQVSSTLIRLQPCQHLRILDCDWHTSLFLGGIHECMESISTRTIIRSSGMAEEEGFHISEGHHLKLENQGNTFQFITSSASLSEQLLNSTSIAQNDRSGRS